MRYILLLILSILTNVGFAQKQKTNVGVNAGETHLRGDVILDNYTGSKSNEFVRLDSITGEIIFSEITVGLDSNYINNLLSGKEDSVAPGTTSQYYRGDKSWQTLDKSAVGLGNVDNTSDADKPVSTATQAAIDAIPVFDASGIRDTINAHNDSIAAHRVNINALHDSVDAHLFHISDLYDSISIHRQAILDNIDSLGVHKQAINALYDSIAVYQLLVSALQDSVNAHRIAIDLNAAAIAGLGLTYHKQNGNTYGADLVVGTNDNYDAVIETNNTTRVRVDKGGNSIYKYVNADNLFASNNAFYTLRRAATNYDAMLKFDTYNPSYVTEYRIGVKANKTYFSLDRSSVDLLNIFSNGNGCIGCNGVDNGLGKLQVKDGNIWTNNDVKVSRTITMDDATKPAYTTSLGGYIHGKWSTLMMGNSSAFPFAWWINLVYTGAYKHQNTGSAIEIYPTTSALFWRYAPSASAGANASLATVFTHDLARKVFKFGTSAVNNWDNMTGVDEGLNTAIAHGIINDIYVSSNAKFESGAYRYMSSNKASMYLSYNGEHYFYVAPTGTAGNAITWTLPLKIDNSGNVLFQNLSNYADNAAAISGGLPTGAVYRSGDYLKIVH